MSWYLLKARNWFSTKAPTDLFIWLNLHACLNVPKRSNFLYMTLFQRYFWFICVCALRRHDDPAYEKRHSFRGGHSVLYSRDSPGYWLHSPTGLHSPGYQTRQPTAWLTGKTHLHAIIYIYIRLPASGILLQWCRRCHVAFSFSLFLVESCWIVLLSYCILLNPRATSSCRTLACAQAWRRLIAPSFIETLHITLQVTSVSITLFSLMLFKFFTKKKKKDWSCATHPCLPTALKCPKLVWNLACMEWFQLHPPLHLSARTETWKYTGLKE